MSKSSATDGGVGSAILTTRIGLSIQAFRMCFSFGFLPGLLIPIILWFVLVSPLSLSLVKIDILSSVLSSGAAREWRVTDNSGRRAVVVASTSDGRNVQLFTAKQIPAVLADKWAPVRTFHWLLVGAVALGVFGYAAVAMVLRRIGRKKQESVRIRGAQEVVKPEELANMVRKKGPSEYTLAGIPLPKEAPMMGILAIGSQGSGKSMALHDLMVQVFKNKRKAIVYDESGEFFEAHFRPGKDVFFNPALDGSVDWSLPLELKYTYDADSMGRAFLPPKAGAGGANVFFEDAARTLFSVILLRLRELGAEHTSDIAKAFLEMPEEEMQHLIANSIASSAIDGDAKAQRQGVISSIAIYLNGIQSVKPGKWTLRKWLEVPDDSRLFILNTEDTRAMFAPLYRLMLASAFSAIESKQEKVFYDRYWFFMDELSSIGDVRSDEKLAKDRKYGVCIAGGFQTDKQLSLELGADRSEIVMNGFNTTLMLRVQDPGLQKRLAGRIGELEETVVNQNQQLALVTSRDGGGLNQIEKQRFSVMPSELGELETATGYIKVVGGFPPARVDYRKWLPRRPGKRAHVDRWKSKNELPPRDESFLIQVQQNEDAFAVVKSEVAERKAAAAEIEAAGKAEPDLMWKVELLDSLEEPEPGEKGASAAASQEPAAQGGAPSSTPKTLKF